jgi:hypothetical protein
MAFPTVEGTPTGGGDGSATTNHNVVLPTGIVAGELLLIYSSMAGAAISTITGWTKIGSSEGSGSNPSENWFYRFADGTEGSQVNLVTDNSVKNTFQAFRIGNHAGSGTPPETGTYSSGTGAANAADPPALTPSWGSADTLWLAASAFSSGVTPTAAPTNYTNLTTSVSTGGSVASRSGTGVARRELTATTDDPGVFTHSLNDWKAQTLAVRPAAAAADDPSGGVAPGVFGWWDFSNLGLGNNVAIDTLTDRSGLGHHMTQAGTARPLQITNIQNGLSVGRFDGVNDYMQSPVAFSGNDITIYAVGCFMGALSVTDDPYLSSNLASGFAGLYTIFHNLGGFTQWDGCLGRGTVLRGAVPKTWGILTWRTTVDPNGSGNCSVINDYYWNGRDLACSHGSGNWATLKLVLCTDADAGTGSRYGQFDIGDVVAYEASHTPTERAAVEDALWSKWALTHQFSELTPAAGIT